MEVKLRPASGTYISWYIECPVCRYLLSEYNYVLPCVCVPLVW